MARTLPKSVKLWGRGQLTIPKEIRQAMKLDDETQLSIFVVGRCMILTPKRLLRSSLVKDAENHEEQRTQLGRQAWPISKPNANVITKKPPGADRREVFWLIRPF